MFVKKKATLCRQRNLLRAGAGWLNARVCWVGGWMDDIRKYVVHPQPGGSLSTLTDSAVGVGGLQHHRTAGSAPAPIGRPGLVLPARGRDSRELATNRPGYFPGRPAPYNNNPARLLLLLLL